jgi:hypothetical protein
LSALILLRGGWHCCFVVAGAMLLKELVDDGGGGPVAEINSQSTLQFFPLQSRRFSLILHIHFSTVFDKVHIKFTKKGKI